MLRRLLVRTGRNAVDPLAFHVGQAVAFGGGRQTHDLAVLAARQQGFAAFVDSCRKQAVMQIEHLVALIEPVHRPFRESEIGSVAEKRGGNAMIGKIEGSDGRHGRSGVGLASLESAFELGTV